MRKMIVAMIVSIVAVTGVARGEDENLRRTFVVKVVEANRDSVVNINTTQIIRQRFDQDPFFRFFGGMPQQQDVKRTSLGSGFIVHASGVIVTNAHVVDGADEVEVIMADGSRLPAQILAADTQDDLAVLKIEAPANHKLRPVELGDSSDLMIGEPVIAIGDPLGFQHTVTTGVVSATNRVVQVSQEWKLTGLVQTDTAINPGNSGGPLMNAYGQVIGICSAIRGDAQNIGFAIPVGKLRELIPELMNPRAVNQVDVGGQLVEKTKVEPPAKLHTEVFWKPAGAATMEPITSINGVKVANIVEASVELLKCQKGQKLVLGGPGANVEVLVKAAEMSNGQRLAKAVMGIEVRELSAAELAKMGGKKSAGLLITGVAATGPGADGGLKAGDVISQVGRYRITDLSSLAVLLGEIKDAVPADVFVIRKGQVGRARLTLRPAHGDL